MVGLGPGRAEQITVETSGWLTGKFPVYLRTRVHPTIAELPGADAWPSFDRLYDEATDFTSLYGAIVDELLERARAAGTPVVYAVPGHPLVGESTVTRLLENAPGRGVRVRVLPAVSFLDVATTALGLDPLAANLQLVDALELAATANDEPFSGGRALLSPARPALVAQVYSAAVASAAKLALMRFFPDEHPITLLQASGTAGATVRELPLHALDRYSVDHLTSLYVPAVAATATTRAASGLQAIVARLRAPGGCPWDREQTHQSIRKHLLEETCEALDAIDAGDPDDLREELGDLLLQVYLHAQMAEEEGDFLLEDVYQSISEKLVRRHPHVFGEVVAADSDTVLRNWERIKATERSTKSGGARNDEPSALAGVPRALPALARARLVQDRANRLVPGPRESSAYRARAGAALGGLASRDPACQVEQLGAALFALAGVARALGLDAEGALDAAIAQFSARFARLEGELYANSREWRDVTPDEKAVLWQTGVAH